MLNVFEPCTLQLGDKSFYRLKCTDKVVSVQEWNQCQKKSLFPTISKEKRANKGHKSSDEWESEVSDDEEEHTSAGRSSNQGKLFRLYIAARI